MSNSDNKEGIEKQREEMESQVEGDESGSFQDPPLAAPEVKDIMPGLPEGLLPVSALAADLDVRIPYWNVPVPAGFYADVDLNIVNSEGIIVYTNKIKFNGPLDAADFPLPHNISKSSIPHEGVYTFAYGVISSVGNQNRSDPRTITIDRSPPYYDPDPDKAFPTALTVPAPVITDDTFAGGVTTFDCTLPDYPGITDEDKIVVYWEHGLPPESPTAPNPAFGPVVIPTDRKIPIPKAIIEDRPNGPTFAVYWLTDKAGNVSSISQPAYVDVQLGPLPENLLPPRVPLGPLVNLADAHEGVVVVIPAFNNPGGTFIHSTWGGTALGVVGAGTIPLDIEVPVPWSTLKAEYLGPGVKPLRVGYQIKRGSLSFPPAPLTLDIQVDFSTVGPGNPDEPDPVNPTLPPVHLTGADGGQDHLTPSDDGLDITATTLLYPAAAATEVLSLFWGSDKNPVDDFTVVAEQPGDPITFTIPWAAIKAQANNPALPMYYSINSTPPGNNPQLSKDTLVNVDVLRVAFEPVSFPDVYENDEGGKALSCPSLYSENYDDPTAKFGFRVAVPGDTDFNVGDVVEAVWQGYELDGTTAIPATRFTYTHPPLKQEEVINGFIFLVEPYDTHILPILMGYAEVTYTVTPVGGGAPVPANPMPEKQLVWLVRPGDSVTCEVPPPKPTP